ncbi:hypothetical protein [Paenarthrobacter aromaticivorans]|uniref:Uncharacterized protein n=1 Tax=Paenarthrobacter aromaticivorans TaxID=2849150 RepID=A0ABS6I420_9MICC|nr:hypothetical protein [Paenarthrobacter sp. MMS21-TAE1-1]MBU8866491.1 hypothetical protein [Paenarthrobacter sp. MMS21-TAE1-1]
MKRLLKARTTTVLLGAILLVGSGIGVASATSQPPAQVVPLAPAVVLGDGVFEKNAAGQTYGLPTEVDGVTVEPDLIRAYATNDRIGYVRNSERKVATGDPSLFKSPEEALQWQANRPKGPVSIGVYDLDGVTVIGEFVFSEGTVTSSTDK